MNISYYDQELSDISTLVSELKNEIILKKKHINIPELDYSIKNLSDIDTFIDKIRKCNLETTIDTLVLRLGAYVGETIRKNCASSTCHWVSYKDACEMDNSICQYPYIIETAYILWNGNKTFCFPMAKVSKFMAKGRVDSVKSFATVIIDLWENKSKPLSARTSTRKTSM